MVIINVSQTMLTKKTEWPVLLWRQRPDYG
ncbi:MAG: hypothetical protein RLZZ316_23, partial [Bacteroidota bacterium]